MFGNLRSATISAAIPLKALTCIALLSSLSGCTAQVDAPVEVGDDPIATDQEALTQYGSFLNNYYIGGHSTHQVGVPNAPQGLKFLIDYVAIFFQPVVVTIDNSQGTYGVVFDSASLRLSCEGATGARWDGAPYVGPGKKVKVTMPCFLPPVSLDINTSFHWAT